MRRRLAGVAAAWRDPDAQIEAWRDRAGVGPGRPLTVAAQAAAARGGPAVLASPAAVRAAVAAVAKDGAKPGRKPVAYRPCVHPGRPLARACRNCVRRLGNG